MATLSVHIRTNVRWGNHTGNAAIDAFTNAQGVATDPTAVTLRLEKPEGGPILVYGWPAAGANGTLIREEAGRFYIDYPPDVAGNWKCELNGTGVIVAEISWSVFVRRSLVRQVAA